MKTLEDTFREGVLKDVGSLCMDELFSDMWFIVEDQRLPAHRMILANRSLYFRALLYGDMTESNEPDVPQEEPQEEPLEEPLEVSLEEPLEESMEEPLKKPMEVRLDVPLEAFKVILRYLYSGTLAVSVDVDATSKVLGLANLYILPEVVLALAKHLQNNLSISNTCMILDTACKFNLAELSMKCLKFMDKNAPQVLKHQSFQMLSKESLEEVLRRDTLIEHEINVFQSVLKWSRHNQGVDIKSVLSLVRLSLISVEDLVRVVRPSGIVESVKILDAIEKPIITSILPYRAHVSPGVDVAFHLGKGFVVNQNEIVIKLSFWCIINIISIEVILKTNDTPNCTVEVSCDMIHWDGVGNIELSTPTQQEIHFTRMPVRFIRIVDPESGRKDVLSYLLLKAVLNNTIP
ncbi:BTB/POZ domain-containing protein 9-like [Drosophila miranda]|uniref:BTB/POZ domain-containing protein 9-like n=1 Tax=Drosophila miranda TaxID=7229 RepID=UPI0007E6BF63|nr:BTB/POZ domain-containing protein 9-like [Drosophila miranda]